MHLSTLPSKLSKPLAFALLAVAGPAALPARAETHVSLNLQLGAPAPVVVREAPPRPVIVEQRYASPGAGFVWVPGHNSWDRGRWVWIPGTWARPPQANTIYVDGYWDERSRNWIEPHWEIVRTPAPPPPPTVVVVQAPPRPRYDAPGRRPSSGYVWLEGFWTWRGREYVWVPGHWERPPHGHGKWQNPRWERRGGSYVFVEGHWY